MTAVVVAWLIARTIRWLAWIVFFGWSFYFWLDRAPHFNSLGQLLPRSEALWFFSATVGVFAGFVELMMRERAGLPRPRFGELIPSSCGGEQLKTPSLHR